MIDWLVRFTVDYGETMKRLLGVVLYGVVFMDEQMKQNVLLQLL